MTTTTAQLDNFTRITPVLIVKNGAEHITHTLEALREFKQVVVYDNGSTDETIVLASRFPNVQLVQGSFLGFGHTKNAAAAAAPTDWIFSLDVDERPTPELLRTLASLPLDNPNWVGVVLRLNKFCGKIIRTNGWGNDWLTRIYNRQQHAFTPSMVHEKVALQSQSRAERLRGGLEHETTTDIAQMLQKIQHYSELNATSGKAKLYSFPSIVVKTAFAFFRSYILKAGLLSGSRGFIIAVGAAMGVFFKYSKVYQRHHYQKDNS